MNKRPLSSASHSPSRQQDEELRRLQKALFRAIEDRDADEVIRLAPKIDDLDAMRVSYSDDTPLLLAARRDLAPRALKILLARSDPTLRSTDGSTPLAFAAWGSEAHSAELVRLLLPCCDPLALRDENGQGAGNSALHCAIFCKNREIIAMLLPVSDLAQIDRMGMTPLDQALDSHSEAIADMIRAEAARRDALALAAEISSARGLPDARIPAPRL